MAVPEVATFQNCSYRIFVLVSLLQEGMTVFYYIFISVGKPPFSFNGQKPFYGWFSYDISSWKSVSLKTIT